MTGLRSRLSEAFTLAVQHAAASTSTNAGGLTMDDLASVAVAAFEAWEDERDLAVAERVLADPGELATLDEVLRRELRDDLIKALKGPYPSDDIRPSGRAADAVLAVVEPRLAERFEAEDELATELAEARIDLQKQEVEIERLRKALPECNGICLTGSGIGVPSGTDVAYPHPECEAHGDPVGEARARAETAEAAVARVRAVHHPVEWVSLSDVCGRHHAFRTVEPNPETIAVADVCPDCQPKRYMACACNDDECATLAALDQPKETE